MALKDNLHPIRKAVRSARLHALDLVDLVTRRRAPMTPPRLEVEAIGGGDFHQVGRHLAELVIDVAALQPHERILDAGCGIGRLAVPLTSHLETGEYVGFDVSRSAISWCRRAISRRHSNFFFAEVDVYSRHYNRRGRTLAAEFVFPCATESVDVAFFGSVFTHLTPDAAAQYVSETARVLKRGGRALMTFFLLDDAVREKAREGRLVPAFATFPEPWWAVQDPADPEAAVAYDVQVVEDALRARGLAISSISRGAWSQHPSSKTYQDLVYAVKQ